MRLLPYLPALDHRNENIGYTKFFSYGDIGPAIFSYTHDFFCSEFRVSPIPGLFRLCCPATVARRVAALIVNAIDRPPRRAFAHVSEKVFKTVSPAGANRDASRAVISEIGEVRVGTACNHRYPSIVSRGFFTKTRVPMGAASGNLLTGHGRPLYRLLGQVTGQRSNVGPSRFIAQVSS